MLNLAVLHKLGKRDMQKSTQLALSEVNDQLHPSAALSPAKETWYRLDTRWDDL
jgi:hypothetical protein